LVTARSAKGITVVLAAAVLLAKLGSCSVAATLAVFVIRPAAAEVGVVDTKSDADEPDGSMPIVQVTVPLVFEQPGVAVLKVTPAGSVSVTTTFVAVDGPSFLTVNM
jgi:hypothetical protein